MLYKCKDVLKWLLLMPMQVVLVNISINRFKPSSQIFYLPFQGGTFLWIFYVFLSFVYYSFVRVCLYVPYGHLLRKG